MSISNSQVSRLPTSIYPLSHFTHLFGGALELSAQRLQERNHCVRCSGHEGPKKEVRIRMEAEQLRDFVTRGNELIEDAQIGARGAVASQINLPPHLERDEKIYVNY